MNDDFLERASAELRAETVRSAEQVADPDVTRKRVLAEAARRQRAKGQARRLRPARRWRKRWFVPFVFALGTGTALARVTYEYFPATWNAVAPAVWQRAARPSAPLVRRSGRRVRDADRGKHASAAVPAPPQPETQPETPAPVAVASAGPQAPKPATAASPPPVARQSASASSSTPAASVSRAQTSKRVGRATWTQRDAPARAERAGGVRVSSVQSPEADTEGLRLFRAAMGMQRAGDGGAVAAWDAFLAHMPHSPLEPEARYNRALSLVRSGRLVAARAALSPFARGAYGDFRRAEAERLLRELDRQLSPASNRASSGPGAP